MTSRHLPLAALLLAAILGFAMTPARADTLQEASKLLKQGQFGPALEKTEQVLAGKPKDAQARFLKGLILTEMNRQGDAIAVFTKLTEDYPELPEPYNNLAVLYAQQKQFEKARNALEMAIRTHPSYATAHENLGDIYARMASQAYDKALQIDSSNTSAQSKLSLIRDLMSVSAQPTAVAVRPAGAGKTLVASAPAAPKPESAAKNEPAVPVQKPAAAAEAKAAAVPAPTNADTRPAAAPETAADVEKAVRNWASAWMRKDVKGYLAAYARDFRTPGGEARAAWESERARRIDKPGAIEVSIEQLRISVEGAERATAKFRQHYRSGTLKTSAGKTLVLVRHDGKWLIQQERVGN